MANALCSVPVYVLWRDGQAELTWVAGYVSSYFTHLTMVTHPSANQKHFW